MVKSPKLRTRGRQPNVVVGALALVSLLGSLACHSPNKTNAQAAPAILRVGISIGEMATANSQNGVQQVAQNQILEGLVKIGDDGRPTAWLAQNWEFAADGRTLTIHLRPDLTFHDGSPVTAPVVAKLLETLLPPFLGPVFADVERITASGTRDLQIALRQPSPLVLEALELQFRSSTAAKAGTGPFQPAGPTAPTELLANDHYYLGRPLIDRIVVTTYPSVRAAWAEMLRDHIDMLYDVGLDALDSLERSTKISSFNYIRRYQYALIFNTHQTALRAPQVRRALSDAIDREAVVREALNGHGIPSSGPIWPHHWALGPASGRPIFDPAAAAKVLATHHLRFTCLVPADYERLALVVKRQLQAVGVSMDIKELPVDEIYAAMAKRNFDAVLFDAVSGPSVFRPFLWWHSGSANPAGFSSATVDAGLDKIRHAASDDEYRSGVAAFQHAAIEDPPAIFLAWSERARAVSKRFVVPDAEPGRDILSTLRFWKPVSNESPASRN
jgi:peptide/nickel transport system substrate-binding protein